MKFYTNFLRYGNRIFIRGYSNGKQFSDKVEYNPILYFPTKEKTEFKTLNGEFVKPVPQGNIKSALNVVKNYNEIENYQVYGSTNFPYVYINDTYSGKINYDVSQIKVANIDIEVASENGFPHVAFASEEIIAITIKIKDTFYVFGCDEYSISKENVQYCKCDSEFDLLQKFLHLWCEHSPDVITGWNVRFFDVPYLYNRMCKILGESEARSLSPWKIVESDNIVIRGSEQGAYNIYGITTLDYYELYRKFTYSQQESYKLDHIAFVELGEKKLDYSEYESLHTLYKNDYQKFIDYNIKDVELVDKLEDKMKLIELAFALAYDAKTNFTDVFTQVRMWDCLIHNYLIDKNIVVPQKRVKRKDVQYAGAYVKDPIVGMHDWIVSFDLNSLYPHLIMQYNISPETIITNRNMPTDIEYYLNPSNEITKTKYSVAASGTCFSKTKQGFLPEIMESMYGERSEYKKKMILAEKEYEKTKDESLINDISRYKNIQMAKKIQLNSAYGALGNEYFRFFDVRQAEAITLSGQLSIRWIANDLNKYLNNLLKTKDEDYVIASDTDSVYMNFGPLISKIFKTETDKNKIVDFLDKACSEKIEPFINESYEKLAKRQNAYSQKMIMKREVIADKGIWTAKKRYILNVWDSEGVRYGSAKLKMSGIEAVKSSTPYSCREKIKEALKVVMNGNQNEFHSFVENAKNEFKQLSFEDIAFPRSVSDINKFKDRVHVYGKGTPIHVRGALLFNSLISKYKLGKKYELIQNGNKVKFCYLKLPNPIQENVLAINNILPKEFELEKYIDYQLQFEKAFLEPLNIIVDKINWTTEKVNTLEGFFS